MLSLAVILKNKKKYLIVTFFFLIYLYSMVVQPYITGGFINLITTFRDWQTFNAGMIALLASIIAAYIAINLDMSARQREAVRTRESRNNERLKVKEQLRVLEEQRQRELVAARVFLPAALSVIHTYIERVSYELLTLYRAKKFNQNGQKQIIKIINEFEKTINYQQAFKECIRLSDPDISSDLAYILIHLQVFTARLHLKNDDSSIINIREQLVDSLRFQLKIEGLFDFSRTGDPVVSYYKDHNKYYDRLSIMSDYQMQLSKGADPRLDVFIDSATRRP